MAKLLEEIKFDLNFVKSHTLQPKWYKVFKIFMLIGAIAAYYYFFGLSKTIVFLAVFFFLSFLLHMIYRIKTKKYTQSWLDLKVVKEGNEVKAKSIGKFYYLAVAINAIISIAISQFVA